MCLVLVPVNDGVALSRVIRLDELMTTVACTQPCSHAPRRARFVLHQLDGWR